MEIRAWLGISLTLAAGGSLSGSDWRHFSPILSSQVKTLESNEANNILANFCQSPIHDVRGIGPTCSTRKLGQGFSDITDYTFHPKGIIYGHFLGPESSDAAVSGWSAETHPYLWGGTLLLSRRGSSWLPVEYRSRVITDSCGRIALQDRREILLCETEDSGMGHALHYVYTVDFAHPADLEHSLLAKADSFKDDCIEQVQNFKVIRWSEDHSELSVEVDTTSWKRISGVPHCANYPSTWPATARLVFLVTPQGLRMKEP
jgi:hypothetical protein